MSLWGRGGRSLFYISEAGGDVANLPQIAGLYSQLAGVLAGFAFATLTALVIAQVTSGTTTSRTLESFIPLVGAFIGLTVSSLNYAIVAGEVQGTARVADLQTVAGVGFAVAGLMLFYSLLVLLRGLEKDAPLSIDISERASKITRFIIGALVPVLTLLMYSGLRDHLDVVRGPIYKTGLLWADKTALVIVPVSAVGSFWIAAKRYYTINTSVRPVRYLTIASVLIALASLLAANVLIPFESKSEALPDLAPLLIVAGFSLFATLVHCSAATYTS